MIDYNARIPNNVSLDSDKRLQRALEQWLPNYLSWWQDVGPEGFQARDVYLRTAISVEKPLVVLRREHGEHIRSIRDCK